MFPPDGGVVALRRVEELSLGDPARQLLPVHHLLHLQLFQQSAVLVSAPEIAAVKEAGAV